MKIATLEDDPTELADLVETLYRRIPPLWHAAFPPYTAMIVDPAKTFMEIPFLKHQLTEDGTDATVLSSEAEGPDDWKNCCVYLAYSSESNPNWSLWLRDAGDRDNLALGFFQELGAMLHAANEPLGAVWKSYWVGKVVDGIKVVNEDTTPSFHDAFCNRMTVHPTNLRCRRYKELRAVVLIEEMVQRKQLVFNPTQL